MKIFQAIYHFFDKVEDYVRALLSAHTFIYTFIGGVAIVLFWRGVWLTADILERSGAWGAVLFSSTGSIMLSVIILLTTGLFVSVFIGDSIIMSGIKKEKKDIDKTIDELEDEKDDIKKMLYLIGEVRKEIEVLENKLARHHEAK